MKTIFKLLGSLILLMCIFSCGIFRDKNLAKRYRNQTNINTFGNVESPQKFVKVELNSNLIIEPKEKEVKYNLLSLSDKGQEAFINSANSKSMTSQQLMNLLNTNFAFSQSEKTKVKIIPKTIKKTLIFTIERLHAINDEKTKITTFNNIGDRVSYLELELKIPETNKGMFNTWDKYITDKVTLNLGKVSSAQNWNASLNVSAKGSTEVSLAGSNTSEDFSSGKETNTILVNTGTGSTSTNSYEILSTDKDTGSKTNSVKAVGELGGSATIGYTDKYETSLDLSSQILKLSGTLSENKIILRQEGGPGIDLSGNIVVSVEYALTDDWAAPVQFFKASNLYGSSGIPNASDSISTSYLMVVFPDIQQNVAGELDYSFLYRQVNSGNRHLPEARQKVKFKYGKVFSKDNELIKNGYVDLIKKQDIRPKAYVIRQLRSTENLKFNNSDLKFETAFEAASFLAYIKDLAMNALPLKNFSLNVAPLVNENVSNLQIVTLQL